MAAIGLGWADGAWIAEGWAAGAWQSVAQEPVELSPFLTGVLDLAPFLDAGDLASADFATYWDDEMGFAETVTAQGGEVLGIFDSYSAIDGPPGQGPRVRLSSDDVDDLALERGDILTIRAVQYYCQAFQADGVGSTIIPLKSVS